MKREYKLIAKDDLVELLADLTSKYSSLDPETGNPREINLLKSGIEAIQKEILRRQKDPTESSRYNNSPPPSK